VDANAITAGIALFVSVASVVIAFLQTRIMRQSLKQSLEQNIGKDIAAALAPLLSQTDPSAPASSPEDVHESPIAKALRAYVQNYVGRRLTALQDRTITPTIEALTQRVATTEHTLQQRDQAWQQAEQSVAGLTRRVTKAEADLRNTHVDIYNEILRNLSGVLSDENIIRTLAEETRTAHADVMAAEDRINQQIGRYADDISNHNREIESLQAQMGDVREAINQDLVRRFMKALAEQIGRAAEG
jgi:hypothetical protein